MFTKKQVLILLSLAIVNPVEKIPLWVEGSEGGQKGFHWRLAGLIILSSALILFLLPGRQTMDFLQRNLASFKISGGLNLPQRYQQVFIPMGVPVIAGPGAIAVESMVEGLLDVFPG